MEKREAQGAHLGREDADVEATAHLPPDRYAVRLIADEHDDLEVRAPPAERVRSAGGIARVPRHGGPAVARRARKWRRGPLELRLPRRHAGRRRHDQVLAADLEPVGEVPRGERSRTILKD